MIPDYLIHTFALIGALNMAGIFLGVAWLCWTTYVAHRDARRRLRDLEALMKHARAEYERRNEARIADEWELREAAERVEGAA